MAKITGKQKKERDFELEEQRKRASQFEQWKREAADPEYRWLGYSIINSLGKVTRAEYLELMLLMEDIYPGRGWKQECAELQHFYYEQGLPLNGLRRKSMVAG